MNLMTYSTAKEVLEKGAAEILSIDNDSLGFGKIMIILVDKKHQYQVHLSGAQALAIQYLISDRKERKS